MKKHPIPQPNDYIYITSRKCSDKQSPVIEKGAYYKVKDITKLKSGAVKLIVYSTDGKKTLSVNAERFNWRIADLKEIQEMLFRQQVKMDVDAKLESYSESQLIRLAFVPLIIAEIAWLYTDKVTSYCSDNKISLFKKFTRNTIELHREYIRFNSQDLNSRSIQNIENTGRQFVDEHFRDMNTLYFSVNNEFKRVMPSFPHDEMRTNAIIAYLMIQTLKKFNAKLTNEFKTEKEIVLNPQVRILERILPAYIGDPGKLNYKDKNIALCMTILEKNIEAVEFEVE